jgi:NADPH:quinone reductase-like Zn-dependent oxidoreductase
VVEERVIAIKPAGIDHTHAAAIPLAGQTAGQGLLRQGQLKAGQKVLVHGGSGGVSHYAVQFARARRALGC